MAAGMGDLLQLVDNQSYLGQQILNVYYYRVLSPLGLSDGYLADLNGAWEEGILNPILDLQTAALTHNSREWRNLTNGADLFVNSTVIPGANPGTDSGLTPSFTSLGFLLQRESLATRNGYKRFAGIGEALLSGNTYVGGASTITEVENALAADLVLGLVSVAEPVIVKRPIAVPVTSYIYSSIGSASFRGVGTQNTRKKGRGV